MDPNCVRLLRQGAEAWNRWREENPNDCIDLSGVDLRGANLEGANLSRSCLVGANLSNATLRSVNFSSANLGEACIAFADCENAIFTFARLEKTDLRCANLTECSFEDANLEGADLSHSRLKGTLFVSANLRRAKLAECLLDGVNLTAASLENANVSSVKFDTKIFRALVREAGLSPGSIWRKYEDLLLDTTIRCKGVNAASCHGSQKFKMFLEDQDYLEEFLETSWGRRICALWWISSNCGRSLSRWAAWSFIIAISFACIYWRLGEGDFTASRLEFNFPNMIYYSVVTFTTLGVGDITPATTWAAMLVMSEVIIGYVMLGGLITIFASKLSRRGG